MERGSSKHSPHVDDELAREMDSYIRGAPVPSRVEESRDPEVVTDDQVDSQWIPDGSRPDGAPAPLTGEDLEARSRLGRSIPRSVLPSDRDGLLAGADQMQVPADIRRELERLPAGQVYHTVYEIWEALGYDNEERGS